MFGYVRPWLQNLSQEETERYRAVYCGICRSLGKRYGQMSRLTVNYDMTFLALVLSSLYEPEETDTFMRCAPHPIRRHGETCSEIIDYAADMTVALSYYKCMDDWKDEHRAAAKLYAEGLQESYEAVKVRWSEQCAGIEESIRQLSLLEKKGCADRDEVVRWAGNMTSALFVWKKDFWENQLRWLGDALGRFIYLMDAAMDCDRDRKKGCYNMFVDMGVSIEEAREYIMQPLGEVSEAFEGLPLVKDGRLMRNIIYSGVWQSYNQKIKKAEERKHGK